MNIPLEYFTQEIWDEHDILNIVDKIKKGMYELNEAGVLAFNCIVEILNRAVII